MCEIVSNVFVCFTSSTETRSQTKKASTSSIRPKADRVETVNGVHRIFVKGKLCMEYQPYGPDEQKRAELLSRVIDAKLPQRMD